MENIGRYEIIKRIGKGGMGEVYEARDSLLHRTVAIKRLLSLDSEDGVRRFHLEAQATARLHHPNIIKVYEFGEHHGLPHIVMELLAGPTLRDLMSREEPLKLERVVGIAYETLCGLECAHGQGVFHRDIKPTNIMFGEDGSTKIVDFGVAKLIDTNATRTRVALGTVPYMSPEQVTGKKLDGRMDVFSVGVMLYELLAGYRPFDGADQLDTMKAIACDPPPPLERIGAFKEHQLTGIVHKALEKDKEARFQSASAMAEALLSYLQDMEASGERVEASVAVSIDELIAEGQRYLESGEFWQARNVYQEILKDQPEHSDAQEYLAEAEQGLREARAEELEKVGVLAWKAKDYELAVKSFEELLILDPSNENAVLLIVRARRKQASQEDSGSILDLLEQSASGLDFGDELPPSVLTAQMQNASKTDAAECAAPLSTPATPVIPVTSDALDEAMDELESEPTAATLTQQPSLDAEAEERENRPTDQLPDDVINDVVSLERERAAVSRKKVQLVKKYGGSYVAVLGGKVVGSNPELDPLARSCYEEHGKQPILFQWVPSKLVKKRERSTAEQISPSE